MHFHLSSASYLSKKKIVLCELQLFKFKIFSFSFWYKPAGMESLEPTISLKTHPKKSKSSQWMENLNPLRTCFKNLNYIKNLDLLKNLSQELRLQGGTPQRLWFTFDKFKSSIKNKGSKLNSQWKFNIVCLQMKLQGVFKPKPN